MKPTEWNRHYTREKSSLLYPDENLVRLLKKKIDAFPIQDCLAVDLGCGSGRHIRLLEDLGIKNIIGIDNSFNALKLTQKITTKTIIQGDNSAIPLAANSVDIIVAWGSLHYCDKSTFTGMLQEIYRVLKPGGYFFGTLRSSDDTYLKQGTPKGNDTWNTSLNDIDGTTVSFFTHDEVNNHFNTFSDRQTGKIERSIMGNLEEVISHWVIQAVK